MQEKDDKKTKKHPIEMTTDEALDYLFGAGDCGTIDVGSGQK
jgi:hypothetical protein